MILLIFFPFLILSQNDDDSLTNDQLVNNSINNYYEDMDDDGYPFSIEARNETTGEVICGANATAIDETCVCFPGYVGNPQYGGECYKCLENCSQYAYCVPPGVCECLSEYEGNGTYCVLAAPIIHAMTRVNNSLVVSISFPSDSNIIKGFCRFEGKVVDADVATKMQFICPIPPETKQHSIFQISIDGQHWTMDNLIYEDQSKIERTSNGLSRNITIIVFILSMIGLTLLLANSKPVNRDEIVPFIQEKPRASQKISHQNDVL